MAEGRVGGALADLLIEASPLPSFETAAGHFSHSADIALPAEVVSSYRGAALYLRVLDRHTLKVLAKMSA